MGYYDATNHYLNGYLNDVSIYDTALTDAEITKLSNNQAGRYEYHHTNALGSNIVLTDGAQNVVARYEYGVFGAVRSETGTGDSPCNSLVKSGSQMLNYTTLPLATMTPTSADLRQETLPATALTGMLTPRIIR